MHYVYLQASKPYGTLYIGVTNDLARRIYEHKQHLVKGFTQTYNVTRLVHVEPFESISQAIQREKNLKHWIRQWKVDLIEKHNPEWQDLYEDMLM